MTTFRVTLSIDVDVAPIRVPNSDTMSAGKPATKAIPQEELVAAMRKKGMSDDEIKAHLAEKSPQKKAPDYQMLLYPEYERWAEAQQRLQHAILSDESLRDEYVLAMARDLLRGRLDTLMDEACEGAPLLELLQSALATLPPEDQAVLRGDQQGLLFDETELLDNSVSCRLNGISVDHA